MKNYIGIDPGAKGAAACLADDGIVVGLINFKDSTPHEIDDWLNENVGLKTVAYIEQVGAMPGQGVSTMFKFGFNAGLIEGMMISARCEIVKVTPHKWQKGLGITHKKTDSGYQKKKTLREAAQRMFAGTLSAKITNSNADALLIARYALEMDK